jgi:hypothetical protein
VVEGSSGLQGSTAPEVLAQFFENQLGLTSSILFVPQPSCAAVNDLVARQGAPAGSHAYQLQPGGAIADAIECVVDNPFTADLVISELWPSTCAEDLGTPSAAMLTASANAWQDFLGPVEVTAFAVPFASTEMSISADAAYVTFGWGGAPPYNVAPWSTDAGAGDPNLLAPAWQTAPLNVVASAIHLAPSQKWAVTPLTGSNTTDAVVKKLTSTTSPGTAKATLGIVPYAAVAKLGGSVRVLAYEHTGQSCGYLPSSDALHGDLVNVRQGRYALWAPLHVLIDVDVTGALVDHTGASNPYLDAIANFLSAQGPSPPPAAIADAGPDAEGAPDASPGAVAASPPAISATTYFTEMASATLVPWCAMQVLRTSEVGPEASYQPQVPCGCAFESFFGTPTTQCFPCITDNDCNTEFPACNYGYCEVQ